MNCLALLRHQCCTLMGLHLRVAYCITALVLTVRCCQIPFSPKVQSVNRFFQLLLACWRGTCTTTEQNSAASLGVQSLLLQHSRLWSPLDDSR